MPTFLLSVQYAEFHDDQTEDRGVTQARDILAAFDAFDWPGQVEISNRLERCSPTFSVRDLESERLFWVSGVGDRTSLSFVSDYCFSGEVRRLFRRSRTVERVSAPTRELSLADARRGIELFVQGDHAALLKHLAPR